MTNAVVQALAGSVVSLMVTNATIVTDVAETCHIETNVVEASNPKITIVKSVWTLYLNWRGVGYTMTRDQVLKSTVEKRTEKAK